MVAHGSDVVAPARSGTSARTAAIGVPLANAGQQTDALARLVAELSGISPPLPYIK